MAIYNEILSGRFASMLQRLFSMKGEQALKQLSGELMAVQNLPFGVEHRFLLGENRFGSAMNITGAAAQFAAFRLRNPVGSGIIAVVESLAIANASTVQSFSADISPQTTDLAVTSLLGQRLDGRIGANVNRPASSLSQQTTLVSAVVATIFNLPIPQNGFIQVVTTENQELTVTPGDALTVGNQNAASNLTLFLFWRERYLEESERR